ncbi:MAG: hypothetical protein RSB55_00890 [Oscillospiraceae bacterium]
MKEKINHDCDLMTLLAGARELPLMKGYALRLLSAWELLDARREAALLQGEIGGEASLCSNACLLARALVWEEGAVFSAGKQVLEELTQGQIETLAQRWATWNAAENPSLREGQGRLDALKKAWSTRLTPAFSGVCSKTRGHCLRKNASGT